MGGVILRKKFADITRGVKFPHTARGSKENFVERTQQLERWQVGFAPI